MFEDTRPAEIDPKAGHEGLRSFLVEHPGEALALMRRLRDGSTPLNLNAPGGAALTATLWSVDDRQQRLNFNLDPQHPQLEALIAADEAVAVAYLDNVKLQFDLHGMLLVRSANASVLQTEWPAHVYRFQRRDSYRVRTIERHAPTARLRHPAIAEMALALRVLDVSIGGCALFVPKDVPPLEPGLTLHGVSLELDGDTRFVVSLLLHHVTSVPGSDQGVRIGCEWVGLPPPATRSLQRYIDQTQKRRRLMSLE